jgi:hypothetical protein
MNNLKSSTHIFFQVALCSIMGNLWLMFFSSASISGDVYGSEIRYGSCSQLQKKMNDRNSPNFVYRGFERSGLARKTRAHNAYFIYCNGGTIIDREERNICRGYIGYAYSPKLGVAQYFGDWGWTDGSPNDADSGKERYCQGLK